MAKEGSDFLKILIPDGESHLVISVINCLQENKKHHLYILSNTRNNPVKVSRFVKIFIVDTTTKDNDTQFATTINQIIQQHAIDIIMPVFEFGIKRIIKIQNNLLPKARLVPLPDLDVFTIANNKWNLYQYCCQYQFPVPRSYHTDEVVQATDKKNYKFPLITKPLEGFGGGIGISLLQTPQELSEFLQQNKDPRIFQEYITGYDIDCSLLALKGTIISYTIQKGLAQNHLNFKPSKGISFEENPVVYTQVQKLIASLNYTGIAHIDMRFDSVENNFKILEINPRAWLTIMGSYKAGVNFIWQWIRTSAKDNFQNSTFKTNLKYYNRKRDILKMIFKKPVLLFNYSFFKNQTPIFFMLRDPLPVMYRALDSFKNVLLKKLKRS